jgi:hypothetical protein
MVTIGMTGSRLWGGGDSLAAPTPPDLSPCLNEALIAALRDRNEHNA